MIYPLLVLNGKELDAKRMIKFTLIKGGLVWIL